MKVINFDPSKKMPNISEDDINNKIIISRKRNYVYYRDIFNYMIKVEKNKFFSATEIAVLLGVSNSSAYRIIKKLNYELESMGKITVAGKISRRFFEEKVYI